MGLYRDNGTEHGNYYITIASTMKTHFFNRKVQVVCCRHKCSSDRHDPTHDWLTPSSASPDPQITEVRTTYMLSMHLCSINLQEVLIHMSRDCDISLLPFQYRPCEGNDRIYSFSPEVQPKPPKPSTLNPESFNPETLNLNPYSMSPRPYSSNSRPSAQRLCSRSWALAWQRPQWPVTRSGV